MDNPTNKASKGETPSPAVMVNEMPRDRRIIPV
jgi:hypothetical protein